MGLVNVVSEVRVRMELNWSGLTSKGKKRGNRAVGWVLYVRGKDGKILPRWMKVIMINIGEKDSVKRMGIKTSGGDN